MRENEIWSTTPSASGKRGRPSSTSRCPWLGARPARTRAPGIKRSHNRRRGTSSGGPGRRLGSHRRRLEDTVGGVGRAAPVLEQGQAALGGVGGHVDLHVGAEVIEAE